MRSVVASVMHDTTRDNYVLGFAAVSVVLCCVVLSSSCRSWRACTAVQVSIPLITTNRINMPDTAERVLAEGHADMISMARYVPCRSCRVFCLPL